MPETIAPGRPTSVPSGRLTLPTIAAGTPNTIASGVAAVV